MEPIATFGSVRVYAHPIADEGGSRVKRQTEAVMEILWRVLGLHVFVSHGPNGEPFINKMGWSISISHSRNTAVVALDPEGSEIGVDIEEPRTQLLRVAPRVLSSTEMEAYGTSAMTLASAWTLKEAAYKCAGLSGVDFVRDIVLPHRSAPGEIVTVCDRRLRILYSSVFNGEYLTLVQRAFR